VFVGNYQAAYEELFNILLQGILKGWAGNHVACWQWSSSSELELLSQIRVKVSTVVEHALVEFVELPISYSGWVKRKVNDPMPIKKILAHTLAELETFWSTKNKYQERRIRSIKHEVRKSLETFEYAWRRDEEASKTKRRY
jgi:hypothetical protein